MSRTILSIDPGTSHSGYCFLEEIQPQQYRIKKSGNASNEEMKKIIATSSVNGNLLPDLISVEMVASYGLPVGKETFETCLWIGRFLENWSGEYKLIYRKQVLKHLGIKSAKGSDSKVRQAMIDKFGEPGTSKEQGGTYGVSSHAWSALAVGVTALETV